MKFLSASRGRLQQFSLALVIIVIFFAGFALGNQYAVIKAQGQGDEAPPPGAETTFAPFWQVYNLIQSDYLNPVDTQKLVDGATKGLVDALGDPFSGYMDPQLYNLMNSDLSGEFNGIGVVIHTVEATGQIEVVGILDGAPAADSGIRPGDVFTAVDGVDVTTKNQTDLAVLVRGPEGTDVTVTMRRGDQLIDFTITRAQITVPNVESRILEDSNMGYIKLNQFAATARPDIDAALTSIDVNHRAGLILDLRDNPGGLLTSAIDVASAFIPSGTVVIEDFGHNNEHTYEATGNTAGITVPIVVLVNESSASASELLAGALQDHHAATIIGTTTFGKGTVQTWHQLVNGGGVRLTIARWLTPDGRWIHEQGITPDITVDWTRETFAADEPDPQLDAAVTYLQSGNTEAVAATEQAASIEAISTEAAAVSTEAAPLPQ